MALFKHFVSRQKENLFYLFNLKLCFMRFSLLLELYSLILLIMSRIFKIPRTAMVHLLVSC